MAEPLLQLADLRAERVHLLRELPDHALEPRAVRALGVDLRAGVLDVLVLLLRVAPAALVVAKVQHGQVGVELVLLVVRRVTHHCRVDQHPAPGG